jgi:hypothetical protein
MAVTYLTLPKLGVVVGAYGNITSYKKEFQTFTSRKSHLNLEHLTTSFIEAQDIPKKQKIDLMLVLLANENNDYTFDYLTDILTFLDPIGSLEDIISLAKNTQETSKKVMLLRVLGSTAYETITLGSDDKIRISQSNTKAYLYSVLERYSDSSYDVIFNSAFTSYTQLAEPREVLDAVQAFLSGGKNPNYPREQLTNILVRHAFRDEGVLVELLPKLLSDEYQKDDDFYGTLSFWANKSDLTFPAVTTELLKETITSRVDSFPEEYLAASGIEMSEFIDEVWVLSKISRAAGVTPEDKVVNFSMDKFFTDKQLVKLSVVIMLSGKSALEMFKERKEEILPAFKKALETTAVDSRVDELYNEIIRLLKE